VSVSPKVELEGGVRVTVNAVDVPTPRRPVGCFAYLTEGLVRLHGQQEILFLLRRTAIDPEASQMPVSVLEKVVGLAKQGQVVHAGEHTALAQNAYLAQRGWGGWIYLPSQRSAGVSAQTLHAIAVTPDELTVAQVVGATRIAARFGHAASYWPFPPWSEPHPSFAAPDELERSTLGKVPVWRGLGVSVTPAGERIRMRLWRAAAPALRDRFDELAMDQVVAFSAVVGEEADACMVWAPGHTKPSVISEPGSAGARMAAAFLMFVPQQEADQSGYWEDGLTCTVTDATWARLRTALSTGAPFSVLLGDVRLELEWV
jgi:hypothetical protein